jgi:hypothetical protein
MHAPERSVSSAIIDMSQRRPMPTPRAVSAKPFIQIQTSGQRTCRPVAKRACQTNGKKRRYIFFPIKPAHSLDYIVALVAKNAREKFEFRELAAGKNVLKAGDGVFPIRQTAFQ